MAAKKAAKKSKTEKCRDRIFRQVMKETDRPLAQRRAIALSKIRDKCGAGAVPPPPPESRRRKTGGRRS